MYSHTFMTNERFVTTLNSALLALCRLFIVTTVTKHLRNMRIQEKNQQNLQGKLQKQTVEVSVNSFVLAETPKCVQQTPNKRLPLKYIAEQTCVMQHF